MKYDKYKIEVYVRPNEISGSDLTNTGHFLSTALLSQHYFQKKEFYFCIIILQLYLMTIKNTKLNQLNKLYSWSKPAVVLHSMRLCISFLEKGGLRMKTENVHIYNQLLKWIPCLSKYSNILKILHTLNLFFKDQKNTLMIKKNFWNVSE